MSKTERELAVLSLRALKNTSVSSPSHFLLTQNTGGHAYFVASKRNDVKLLLKEILPKVNSAVEGEVYLDGSTLMFRCAIDPASWLGKAKTYLSRNKAVLSSPGQLQGKVAR